MLKNEIKSSMVVHAYDSSTWETEERSGIYAWSQSHCEFEGRVAGWGPVSKGGG